MLAGKLQLFSITLLTILAGSLLLPTLCSAQRRERLIGRFGDGYLRFDFAGRRLTHFEFHRTNSQGNFCDVEARRDSTDSRWRAEGNVTRIELDEGSGNEFKSNGEILISRLGKRIEVVFGIANTSRICGFGRQLPARIEVYRDNRRIKVKVSE